MVNSTLTPEHNIATTIDGTEYIYNLGDIAWIIVATALVMIMIPGLGFFYAGLLRRKNALAMIWMSMCVFAVVSIEWFFWGFSLAFSEKAGPFIGNLDHFGLMNVDIQPSVGGSTIPSLLYCIYQMMFAAITPVIACGAFADRARLGPILVFAFCWSTIVYNPIANWTWNVGNGWVNKLGGLDFAGGTPVHISSGTAALAISIFLGKRHGYGTDTLAYRPYNVSYVVLGTVFLLFGWYGFNGGSALGANLRAVQAIMVTNTAACMGGLTWMFWDWRLERKWSAVGFCSGVISGLVAITPASGYVGTPASIAFGFVGATACNFATGLKSLIKVDDSLDIFAAHAVGGIVGNLMTGLFADNRVASFDGSALIPGGWINHHYIQLAIQLLDCVTGLAWSFIVTMILLFIIDRIPGLHFRCTEDEEILGIDLAQIGEEVQYVPIASDLSSEERANMDIGAKMQHTPSDSSHGEKIPEDLEAAQQVSMQAQ
ncbi:putative high affinity ammonium transporter [Tilletiaria anomala UBC 951]|uniref:Ammonium transporter n=1 Tax=Tilletiaria anomala (strain ATCC 24038 / CBS 436.72 / UBC 951) TaxID=1037660 RepID=A0A066VIM9_TILAU|nr:putative high affinity ammonium transporter [Tilletiaria anomala UBC 951]KDN41602.1 putative high affinity ammonium transporter [Tilletiaria anomala UBC 951]